MEKFYFMIDTRILVPHTGRIVTPKHVVVQYGKDAKDAQERMILGAVVHCVICDVTGLVPSDYDLLEYTVTQVQAPETRKYFVPVQPSYNVGTLHAKVIEA